MMLEQPPSLTSESLKSSPLENQTQTTWFLSTIIHNGVGVVVVVAIVVVVTH